MKKYFDYTVYEDGTIISKFGTILKPTISKNGYYFVNLHINKGRKKMYVHRIVALCYIDNPENKATVNHKDGDKGNNSVSNLEWLTQIDNTKHAWESGLNNKAFKLNKDQVDEIRFLYNNTKTSHRLLGIRYNVTKSQIYSILNNKSWKA
jgi:hypothetical protein